MNFFMLCCFSLCILMFLALGYYLIKVSFTNKMAKLVVLTIVSLAMIVAAIPILILVLSVLTTTLI